MARDWKARPTPQKTTITEVARRYHAAAIALAQSLGISLAEVLAQYPSAVSTVFIECSRCELRLPASVTLPPLVAPNGHTPVTNVTPAPSPMADSEGQTDGVVTNVPPEPEEEDEEPTVPTAIPADGNLPCAGQEIAALKPAALAMLIAKTATLAHAEGAGWAPLLHALQRERQARLARGQRRPLTVVPPPNGDG